MAKGEGGICVIFVEGGDRHHCSCTYGLLSSCCWWGVWPIVLFQLGLVLNR